MHGFMRMYWAKKAHTAHIAASATVAWLTLCL
jgi:hypothetical protein